ncbi:androgen-dependent TFPI-regulating protein-like [Nymphalis io]|uniref:androgen-dependent TFPI-regulating protein-like n=1 Tax=Inachis io TaxID=171585 RepID=UPI0021674C69|nr:androgen-dependent TFPI-regulating protein-like [Nymphalis io]XP_050358941.1 androgen-dependent TFPI-regulating protein-like [Nymphalis io]
MTTKTYHVYWRLIGHTIGLALHSGNNIAMYFAMQGEVLKDPEIRTLKATQFKYITIWNVAFQMLFLFMSLACDISLLHKVKKEPKYIAYVRSYKDIFFASVVWPLSLTISAVFWPVFIIDRELIFPVYIDKALSLLSNHIMHSSIVPIVLWELLFQPRSRPSSHKWFIAHTIIIASTYMYVLLANYAEHGRWPYPVLNKLYGTPYFALLYIILITIYVLVYSIQWTLTEYLHKKPIKLNKK